MSVRIVQSDLVTACGWGIEPLWNDLLAGRTRIAPTNRFADRGFTSNQAAMVPDLEVEPGGSRAMAMLRRVLSPLIGKLDPQTVLILATTVGEIEYVERSMLDDRPASAAESRPQVLLQRIKQLLGLRGKAMVLSSACASSASALTCGASMIRREEAQQVLVVSCDAISEFVYSGFSTLLSLCENPARPFDGERSGLSLGEAAAWALLQAETLGSECTADASEDCGASILGWGNTTDAIHMTAPDRTAGGLSRAIGKACAMAQCDPKQVAFIAAHGTATVYSDAMELTAFRTIFADRKPIFSVKGAVGHTLGSAGLVQILVLQRAMALRIVPPNVGLSNPDPQALGWAHSAAVEMAPASLAMSTNSGFGGVNTAILLGRRAAP